MKEKKDKSDKERKEIRIFEIISLFGFLVLFVMIFFYLVNQVNLIIEMLGRNFGQAIVDYFILGSIIPFLLLIYIYFSNHITSKLRNHENRKTFKEFFKNPNMLTRLFLIPLIILCTLILIFLVGAAVIDNSFGEKEMKSIRLNNCSNVSQKLGEINCENSFSKNVIAGEEVTCNLTKTNFTFSNGSVNFILADGSNKSDNLTREVKFILPENLAQTTFNLSGTLENNKEICLLSRGNTIRYPDYDEFMRNKSDFIQLIGTLFGFMVIVFLQIAFKILKYK